MADGFRHRVGLTPMMMRIGAYYLAQGEGEYDVEQFEFEKVRVSIAKPWGNHAREHNAEAYRMLFRVEFIKNTKVLRWIEFNTTVTGAGGRPTIYEVVNEEEE